MKVESVTAEVTFRLDEGERFYCRDKSGGWMQVRWGRFRNGSPQLLFLGGLLAVSDTGPVMDQIIPADSDPNMGLFAVPRDLRNELLRLTTPSPADEPEPECEAHEDVQGVPV